MNRDDVIGYVDLYSNGRFEEAVNSYFAQDASFWSTRIVLRGTQKIIDWFTRSHALGYTESVVPVNILIGEDSVAVELEQEFTAYKNVPNHYVAALTKGDTIRTSGLAASCRMKDGKISSIRVYCTLNEYNPKVFGCTEAHEGVEDCGHEK